MPRVLVATSGSAAALKLPELVNRLLDLRQVEVKVVTTEHAKHFYESKDVPAKIYGDLDEWEMWKQRTDPVLHIELRRWADLLVIAPLDANTLGKIANGICDNLLTVEGNKRTQKKLMRSTEEDVQRFLTELNFRLQNVLNCNSIIQLLCYSGIQNDRAKTCVVRAWDLKRPLLFCPAMNTAMWEHPITATQIQTLKGFGYIEVPCIVKKLLCGDEGYGAMAEISTIVEKVQEYLEQSHSYSLQEKQ